MKKIITAEPKAPKKLSGGFWILAGLFILMGAYQLWMYVERGYISITAGATQRGVRYTGPMAIAVIAVCFGVGLIVPFRSWLSKRKSR